MCVRRGFAPEDVAAACCRGGARLLQLRVKAGSSGAFLDLARTVVTLAAPFGAQVVVNDRADIARMAGAAGVHVGQDDLPPEAVRQILGPDAIVGLSTHDVSQIDAAWVTPISYIAVGPIFSTTTKETGYSARGLDLVGYAARGGKAVVAIGGITVSNGRQVLDAGASLLAVIGDLLRGDDPERRTREFLALGNV